jgi:hypothetical protein
MCMWRSRGPYFKVKFHKISFPIMGNTVSDVFVIMGKVTVSTALVH